MTGTVFDIKEFSVHDGPGPRITVFFKGCPLRCRWCHNPEGLSPKPQLLYKKNLCTHCGSCYIPCDHGDCAGLGRCLHACPNGCLSLSGRNYTADELAQRLLSYGPFYQMGGGVTFSGGEPLLQWQFLLELTERLPGIHKAIQTSGYAAPEIYRQVIGKMDFVMQDIKLASEKDHLACTGVSNRQILENIAFLKESGKAFALRVPLIPGITDTAENLTAIAQIAGDAPVELLSYNTLAGAKYEMLEMTYPLGDLSPTREDPCAYFQNARKE